MHTRNILNSIFQRGATVVVTAEQREMILNCLKVVETLKEADEINRESAPKESGWRERFKKEFCSVSGVPIFIGGVLQADNHIAMLEKDADRVIAFIAQVEATAIAATEARVLEIVGTVDYEFLARPDAEEYVGEWSINQDRKRIHEAVRALFSSKNL